MDMSFLYVCSTFEAFVCISCWATVFSNVVTREQSEHQKKLFIEGCIFPGKVLISEAVVGRSHARHCAATWRLKNQF